MLVSEAAELDASDSAQLQDALQSNSNVQTIYEFKQRLKALWNHRIKDSADPLLRLQTWCADAEASGIAALQEFARQLQSYRSQLRYA